MSIKKDKYQITRNEILIGPNRGSSTQLFDDTVVMITSCLINCGNAIH